MRLQGLEIGFLARRLIIRPAAGHVLALFERSCYLALADGVVCLGGSGLGAGPLNLRCSAAPRLDWRGLGLSLGTLVRCGTQDVPGLLALGNNLFVVAGNARAWFPPEPAAGPRRAVSAALAALREAVAAFTLEDGFGPLLLAENPAGVALGDTPLQRSAGPGLDALDSWLQGSFDEGAGDGGPPPRAVRDLIGLGPGLTPSGDDLLCGVLIALRAIGRGDAAERLFGAIEASLGQSTHAISRAHLLAAGEGAGNEALHGLLGDLLAGHVEILAERLQALDRVGHSSGWDGLAGAVMVLRAWLWSRADSLDAA